MSGYGGEPNPSENRGRDIGAGTGRCSCPGCIREIRPAVFRPVNPVNAQAAAGVAVPFPVAVVCHPLLSGAVGDYL